MRLGIVVLDSVNYYFDVDGFGFLGDCSGEVIGGISVLLGNAVKQKTPYWFVVPSVDSVLFDLSVSKSELKKQFSVVDGLRSFVKDAEGVIGKRGYDAFHGNSLLSEINEVGVTHLIFCGALTNTSVQVSVGRAFENGFSIIVVRNGTISQTLLDHNEALDYIQKYYRGKILDKLS